MSSLYLFNSLPQPSNKPLPLDTQRGCVSSLGHPTCVTAPGCIVQKQLRCSCEVHFLTTGYACICVYMCLYICSGKPHTPPYWMVGSVQCGVSHPTARACPFLRSWGCPFRYSCTPWLWTSPFSTKLVAAFTQPLSPTAAVLRLLPRLFGRPEIATKLRPSHHTPSPQGYFFCSSPLCDPSFSHAAWCSRTWALCVCLQSMVLLHLLHQSAAPRLCGTVLIIPSSSNQVLPNALVYPSQY